LIADELKQWFWTKPRRRVHALFRRRELESELEEELEHHISLRADQLVAEGMSPVEARRAAAAGLGGIEQVKEECRDARGLRYLEELWQDTGYAIRTLGKTPAFAFGAIGLLALAIAANVMVASIASALFLNPLPYREPEQLVALSQEYTTQRLHNIPFSQQEVIDLQRQVQSVEQMAGFGYDAFTATGANSVEIVEGAMVSPNLFTVLGIQPMSGQVFDSGQPRDPDVESIVISERLWHRLYASDPALVGKQIRLDDRLRTVLGIMPANFEFPLPGFIGRGPQPDRADIWRPISPTTAATDDKSSTRIYALVGRLKGDASLQQLNRELDVISNIWKEHYGGVYQTGGLRLNAVPLRREIGARMEAGTRVLVAAVLLVWLISVANLVAMLLARAAAARREMAIRMALGGGPLRLLRQAMSEGLLLAILGCASGILLGALGIFSFRAAAAQSEPLLGQMQVNPNVILAAVALSLVTGLLLSLVPGAYALRHATADALKNGRGGSAPRLHSHRLQNQLVIGETALALVLLVAAGLLTKSFLRLQNVYPGFTATGVVTMELTLPETKYPDAGAVADLFSRITREVALLPGINSAAFVSTLPFGGSNTDGSFTIENDPRAGRLPPPDEEMRIITPDYFRVLEIPFLDGRVFTPSDKSDSPPVIIVNQALALRYWGTDDVVGKRIQLNHPIDAKWRTVVGVAGNIKHRALDAPSEPEIYIPHAQMTSRSMVMAVRTNLRPNDAFALIRDKVQSIAPQQPVANPRTLGGAIAASIWPRTLTAALVAIFAAVGLLLAAAGVYAVLSYHTVERRHEIAVRMAVGANRGNIIMMVLKQSGRLLLAGAMIGFVIAVGASLMLKPMLYQVSTFDPVMLLSMLGFLSLCGLAAAYIPARRATRHNLAAALAHD
jgi:predicted permease